MYEDEFETGWETLDREELLERAFALGVEASLGQHDAEELERLRAVAASNYDDSLIELAYTEGRNRARQFEAREYDRTEIWDELVADDSVDGGDRDAERDVPTGLPDSLARVDPAGPPDDGLDRVRLPAFLRKE